MGARLDRRTMPAMRPDQLLYLDFDGVLHHHEVYIDEHNRPYLRGPGALFEYAGRLEAVLDPYPDARIVLSTSWVRIKGFGNACRRLPYALRSRVIGATWHSAFAQDSEFARWWACEASRYAQIAGDVARREPRDWVALDDDDIGWPSEARRHLVACDPQFGLGDHGTRLALEHRLRRWAGSGEESPHESAT